MAGLAQGRTLVHAEFVLLVDHDHREIGEIHVFLKEGLRPDDDFGRAGGDFFKRVLTLGGAQTTDQFHDFQRTVTQNLAHGPNVLAGQDLRRGHDRGLKTVRDGQKDGVNRHGRFAAADVSLEQPVHRPAGSRIARNVADRLELALRQVVGEKLADAAVHLGRGFEDRRTEIADLLPAADFKRELEEKKLLKDKPAAGMVRTVLRFGKVHFLDRLGNRQKRVLLAKRFWKRFVEQLRVLRDHGACDPPQIPLVQAFRKTVNRLKAQKRG